jgi:hypothetical protein
VPQTTGNTLGLKIGNGQIRAMVQSTKSHHVMCRGVGDGGVYILTRSLAHMASMRTVSSRHTPYSLQSPLQLPH